MDWKVVECFYLSVSLSLFLSMSLFRHLSTCRATFLAIYLSTCLFMYLSIDLFIHLSIKMDRSFCSGVCNWSGVLLSHPKIKANSLARNAANREQRQCWCKSSRDNADARPAETMLMQDQQRQCWRMTSRDNADTRPAEAMVMQNRHWPSHTWAQVV